MGIYGSGTFQQSGGTNTVAHLVLVGWYSDSVYELSGGQLSAEEEEIGRACTGAMLQSGGSNTVTDTLTLGGSEGGGAGSYELSGSGQLYVGGDEIIGGVSSSGASFVQSGGTHTAASFLYVGYASGLTGTYDISDGELQARFLWIAYEGIGEFTQTGGTVSADRLDIGREPGSAGTYELSADGALTVEERLTIGRSGNGQMIVSAGTLATEELIIGRYSGVGQLAITDSTAEVTVGTELTFGANGGFTAEPGSAIHMTHDPNNTAAALFDNLSISEFSLSGLANLELSFEGGADLTSTMEIACEDLGAEESGFANNFALGTLRVGTSETPARVQLIDERDNGNHGGPGGDAEALYVDKIFLSANSTLDLNGLHVYYHRLCNDGGMIELNGGLLQRVPAPLHLDNAGEVDPEDVRPIPPP